MRDAVVTVREAPASATVRAARLAEEGLLAFLEGNPFRARRVKEAANALLAALAGPGPDQALATAAQQLAGLAEARPSLRARPDLLQGVQEISRPLLALLAALARPGEAAAAAAIAAHDPGRTRAFLERCAALGRADRAAFSPCLLAAAGARRIDDATVAALQAMRASALLVPA